MVSGGDPAAEVVHGENRMITAVRVRVSLQPREMVHIDSTDNKSLNLESLKS